MPYRRSKIPHARERYIFNRTMVAIMRIMRHALGAKPMDLQDLYIHLGVAVGHYEGRPMTAAKLAKYLELDRMTVTRRLGHLINDYGTARQVQNHYLLDEEKAVELSYFVPIIMRTMLRGAAEMWSVQSAREWRKHLEKGL